jgi:hypothetical protein
MPDKSVLRFFPLQPTKVQDKPISNHKLWTITLNKANQKSSKPNIFMKTLKHPIIMSHKEQIKPTKSILALMLALALTELLIWPITKNSIKMESLSIEKKPLQNNITELHRKSIESFHMKFQINGFPKISLWIKPAIISCLKRQILIHTMPLMITKTFTMISNQIKLILKNLTGHMTRIFIIFHPTLRKTLFKSIKTILRSIRRPI